MLLAPAIFFLAVTPGPRPAVGVDMSAMIEGGLAPEDALQLRGALLVRLVDEGYVVAPSRGDAQMWLTVRPEGEGWSVEAAGAHVYAYHVTRGPLAVLSLEILQRATMALNAAREELFAQGPSNESPSIPAPGSLITAEDVGADRAASSETKWWVSAATSAGVFARSGGVDPIVLAKADIASRWGLGGRLQASIDWSNGGPALSIVEWQMLVGPTWSLRLNPSLTFIAGILPGILVHNFHYDASDNGTRLDWNLAVPAELSYRLGWATLGAGMLAGVTQQSRDHLITGDLVWHRGSSYFGATVGLGVVL